MPGEGGCEKRSVRAHCGTVCTGWPSASNDFPSSVLPDHFGATFIDLHVHHTSRVNVGSQVDLWELCLGVTKTRHVKIIQQHAQTAFHSPFESVSASWKKYGHCVRLHSNLTLCCLWKVPTTTKIVLQRTLSIQFYISALAWKSAKDRVTEWAGERRLIELFPVSGLLDSEGLVKGRSLAT